MTKFILCCVTLDLSVNLTENVSDSLIVKSPNICIFYRFILGSDNCEGILCENGGSCVDAVNFYFCNCTDDYYGDLCQKPHF